MLAVLGEGAVQPGAGQGRRWQVLIHATHLALQQVEGQSSGHGGVALTADARTRGNGFAHRQCEIVDREL